MSTNNGLHQTALSLVRPLLVVSVIMSLIALPLLTAQTVSAQDGPQYEVTVTNLTPGQTFTPILVASHKAGVSLFTLGEPASVEMETVAEGGDTGPLAALLSGMPEVLDVTTGSDPLPPGQSQTFTVRTQGQFDRISATAMLVPTNDGFFAINGAKGPRGQKTSTLFSSAYDAGGEVNDELCIHIPGPPTVCMGEGFNPSRAGDVNFVHIHRGILGVGDLNPAIFDWANPVAKVTIRRIP
jgi:hypothetical protein